MTSCPVCGGQNFVKHAGYFYCSECQTQSQDLREEVYEFHQGDANVRAQPKAKKPKSTTSSQKGPQVAGTWTSWEAFNYILHGMTQELMSLGAPSTFETIVLQLWACYLKHCNVAFISRHSECLPKLNFMFKGRDALVMHKMSPAGLRPKRVKKEKTEAGEAEVSAADNSDSTVMSSRSYNRRKRKLMVQDYEQLSMSHRSDTSGSLANATLESLGRSFDSEMDSEPASETSTVSRKSFTSKGYGKLKKSLKGISVKQYRSMAKVRSAEADFVSKNKLLAILHVGLLLTGSEIQLSDLLRFIREGHLSYAKMTHFLPKEMQFTTNDGKYINTLSDTQMPTHNMQRHVGADVAKMLGVDALPHPPMKALTDRYCRELDLPEYLGVYVERVLASFPPTASHECRPRRYLLNYDGRAMAVILFTMKLLFGLDGSTEVFLSQIARKVNGLPQQGDNTPLFVFEEWVEHLERRKVILSDFDYPTMELVDPNTYTSPKGFVEAVQREDKDAELPNRCLPHPGLMDKVLVNAVKAAISALVASEEKPATSPIQFPPSLTPQTSKLRKIIEVYSTQQEQQHHLLNGQPCSSLRPPPSIFSSNFRDTDIKFLLKPKRYLNILKKHDFKVVKRTKNEVLGARIQYLKQSREAILENLSGAALNETICDVTLRRKDAEEVREEVIEEEEEEEKEEKQKGKEGEGEADEVTSVHGDASYWVLNYTDSSKQRLLVNFKEDILDKTPFYFRWLLLECAAIVEMPPRDLYDELLCVERIYGFFINVKKNFSKLKKDFEEW